MKQILWLLLLSLALPMAAFASSVDFTNSQGTLSGTDAGLSLSGSTLIAVNGLAGLGLVTGNLGTVEFSTAALSSGSLAMGGTFGAGGTFMVTSNGTGGLPAGVIFNGSFTGPVSWTLTTLANGTHNYMLSGALSGTWYTGATVFGATVQLTINTGKGFFAGATQISSGDTNITTAPEPGSLTLLGTLLGIGGILLKKRHSSGSLSSTSP